MQIRRRQLFHLFGGALASPFLGCTRDETAPPPVDPEAGKAWWLRGNYAPVGEMESSSLEVVGALPPELDGLYLRNGPNPVSGTSGHWFLGDGMVHGVRLSGGKASFYRARYVKTAILGVEDDGDLGPPGLDEHPANTAIVDHGGRLLCLCEIGVPYELSRADLSTVGSYDFAGKLAGPMTAHPKIDPTTGEMWFIGYGVLSASVEVHQVDAAGVLVKSETVALPSAVMMHDFQLTARHVVLMDLPILFDLEMAIAGEAFPFRWAPENGARIGVLPRSGGAGDVTWLTVDPCYVFHTLNAFEPDEQHVVLDAVRYPTMWAEGSSEFSGDGSVWRYTIDLAAGTTALEQLDDRPVEMPRIDPRRQGLANRYAYAMTSGVPDSGAGRDAIAKYDLTSGSVTTHALGKGLTTDEPTFVPAGSGEDEGWLLSYVYDAASKTSELRVVDAQTLEAVAQVRLPQRVPYGFHGIWSPAS